jgi:hypothetical protein
VFGVVVTIVGFELIVKHARQLPEPPSGFAMVMFPAPVVALPETSMTTSISPSSTNDVDSFVIPMLLNVTVAPDWKLEPVITTVIPTAPCPA